MRSELLDGSGAHALSSTPDSLETGHTLKKCAFWIALSARVPAGQGFTVLLWSQDGPKLNSGPPIADCQLSQRVLASVETRMPLIHLHFLSFYLNAAQHFRGQKMLGRSCNFKNPKPLSIWSFCSFVWTLDAAERYCAGQSPCWLFQVSRVVGPAPAWELLLLSSHHPDLANGNFLQFISLIYCRDRMLNRCSQCFLFPPNCFLFPPSSEVTFS